jgi:hypothetical protein
VGNVKEQILLANEVIFQLDKASDRRQLTDDEHWLRSQLKRKVLGLASLERTIARQRSRIAWLQEGDVNTAFFHLHASNRRRRNHIFKLRKGDELVTEQLQMEELAAEHYTELLGEPSRRDFTLNLGMLDLPAVDATALELPLSEEEIWAAVKALPPDKAPGPDGFTARFFQSC